MKNRLVTSYSLNLMSTIVFKFRLCQIVHMYMTKPERMYINKHCIFQCSKSKTIHGSTTVYITIYLSIIKGVCALISHIGYFS